MSDIEKAVDLLRFNIRNNTDSMDEFDNTLCLSEAAQSGTIVRSVDIDLEKSRSSIVHLSNTRAANQSAQENILGLNNGSENHKKQIYCKIPLRKMQQSGFITPRTQKGRLTEEFRKIKRPLLKNLQNKVISNGLNNIIAVTSSVAGEGKTYTSINLAMSLAIEKERTVLLVDADGVKGEAGKWFEVSKNTPGLIDVLHNSSIDVSDVIFQTNVKNMRFMPAGDSISNVNELLSSNTMSELVVELARRYDDRIIILDCPPLLQTNEASILVDHAGQVVFVVAEEETRPKLVQNALQQIDSEKYVGIVLNKSSNRIGNYDYYRSAYT